MTACRIDSGIRARSAASGAQQHTAARRGRRPRPRPVDPAERIQLGEEVDERRHDQPLPAALHPQPGHLRDQVEAAGAAAGRAPAPAGCPARARCPRPSAAGTRVVARAGQRDAVPHRPELARPAGSAAPRARPRSAAARRAVGQLTGQLPGAVRAAVVDQEDLRPRPGSPGPAATAGSPAARPPRPGRVRRRSHRTASRAGFRAPGGSRTSVRQKKPWPSSSHSQAASDPTAIHATALTRRSLPHRSAAVEGRSSMVTG